MRTVFEVVSASGTTKWMKDGMPKTRAEIMTELMDERDAWVEKNTNRN